MATGTVLQKLLPLLPLLVPLAAHFILVNFVQLGTINTEFFGDDKRINWLPMTFLFTHLFLFIVGLWTLQDRDGILPVCVFIFVVVVSAVTDMVQLGMYFGIGQDEYGKGDTSYERTWQFSAGMMIVNLLGKPLTIGLACVAIYFRIGGTIPGMNFGGAGGGQQNDYQPVPSGGN